MMQKEELDLKISRSNFATTLGLTILEVSSDISFFDLLQPLFALTIVVVIFVNILLMTRSPPQDDPQVSVENIKHNKRSGLLMSSTSTDHSRTPPQDNSQVSIENIDHNETGLQMSSTSTHQPRHSYVMGSVPAIAHHITIEEAVVAETPIKEMSKPSSEENMYANCVPIMKRKLSFFSSQRRYIENTCWGPCKVEGYLMKKTCGRKTDSLMSNPLWQRRWCVLSEKHFRYYKSSAKVSKEDLRAVFDFDHIIIELSDGLDFYLHFGANMAIFRATCEDDANKWRKCLSAMKKYKEQTSQQAHIVLKR
jgi:hypothetical protein